MKVCTSPAPPPPTPRSSFTSTVSSVSLRKPCISILSTVFAKLTYAILICLFAEVGAILGVMIGALAGLKTKKGFLHGAIVGATDGVILSKEILKLLLAMWDSDDTVMTCFFSLLDSIACLMSRRQLPQRFSRTKVVEEEKEFVMVRATDKVK